MDSCIVFYIENVLLI